MPPLSTLIPLAVVGGGAVLLGFIGLALRQRSRANKPSDTTPAEMEPDYAKAGALPDKTSGGTKLTGGSAAGGILFILIFGGAFMIVGGVVLVLGIRNSVHGIASASWPTTTGVVESSYVNDYTDSDGDTMYEAIVMYTYVAEDHNYTADKVRFGEVNSSSSRPAYRTVEKYPVGTQVTVSYDPDDPGTAVLEPGFKAGNFLLLGIGGLFTLIGLGVGIGGGISTLRNN